MKYRLTRGFMKDLRKLQPGMREDTMKLVDEIAEKFGREKLPNGRRMEKLEPPKPVTRSVRLNDNYRMIFTIIDGVMYFIHVGKHDLYKRS